MLPKNCSLWVAPALFSRPRQMARRWESLIDGLGVDGKLMIVGASVEPFAVSSFQLLLARKSLMGWPAGTSIDSEDTLRFAAANGVQPMIETLALERVADAYERTISGKVRFRSVLKI